MVQQKRIEVPAETLKEMPEADKAQSGEFQELFRNHIKVRGQYEECRTLHNALVKRIKELNLNQGD